MKKLLYFLGALVAFPFFNSCDKVDISHFSGVDGIYFDQQWPSAVPWFDSTRLARQCYSIVAFGSMDNSDSLLEVRVETTGYKRDYDRPFGLEIVEDSTNAISGEDYELLTTDPKISAGQTSTYIRLLVHSTERMNDETVKLQLRLIPGEYFELPFGDDTGVKPLRATGGDIYTEYSTNFDPAIHNIFANRFLTKPAGWLDFRYGTYSRKKYALMLQLCSEQFGWTVSTFEDRNKMASLAVLAARVTATYLTQQYNKGREYWVLDEDGTMMYVSGVAWAAGTNPDDMI
jgi:hypothetical protein